MAAPKPLWAPEALWTLPPSPYVNRTPKADAYEKAKWVAVGLTLFLPRLLLAILTSARVRLEDGMFLRGGDAGAAGALLAREREHVRGRSATHPPLRHTPSDCPCAAAPRCARSFPVLGRRQGLRGGLAARVQAAGAWRRACRARRSERACAPSRHWRRGSRAHVLRLFARPAGRHAAAALRLAQAVRPCCGSARPAWRLLASAAHPLPVVRPHTHATVACLRTPACKR